jgi:hypothetical protein
MAEATVDISAFPTRVYEPVRRCIYCGAFSKHLGKEHILPFGLAGNALILPRACCKTCESIITVFEQNCLRKILGPFRLRVGSPSRSPKDRPQTIPLTHAKTFQGQIFPTETTLVPVAEFPLAFIGLRMRTAGVLLREDATETDKIVDFVMWSRFNDAEVKKYTSPGAGIRIGQIRPRSFGQLLAKIAYGWTVAEVGYGKFKSLVTPFILGKDPYMNHWVGGDWDIPAATDAAFEIKGTAHQTRGRTFLVVNIRLFPFFETPKYHVVVGEI